MQKMDIDFGLNPPEYRHGGWTHVNTPPRETPAPGSDYQLMEEVSPIGSIANPVILDDEDEPSDLSIRSTRKQHANEVKNDLRKRQRAALLTLYHSDQLDYNIWEKLSQFQDPVERQCERERLAREAWRKCKRSGIELEYGLRSLNVMQHIDPLASQFKPSNMRRPQQEAAAP